MPQRIEDILPDLVRERDKRAPRTISPLGPIGHCSGRLRPSGDDAHYRALAHPFREFFYRIGNFFRGKADR